MDLTDLTSIVPNYDLDILHIFVSNIELCKSCAVGDI